MIGQKSYSELLLDPRWQRRRLEILQRADFQCEDCAAADKTLHVHHLIYRKGAMPWEYTNDELRALCCDCHAANHALRMAIDAALAKISVLEPGYLDEILGYILGHIVQAESGRDDWNGAAPVGVTNAEQMIGLARVLGLNAYDGYRLMVDHPDITKDSCMELQKQLIRMRHLRREAA